MNIKGNFQVENESLNLKRVLEILTTVDRIVTACSIRGWSNYTMYSHPRSYLSSSQEYHYNVVLLQ